MRYLDTSVIISAANPEDPNHKRALGLLEHEEKVISDLVKLELYSVTSRTAGAKDEELDALVEHMIELSGAKLMSVDWGEVFKTAYFIAGELRLRSLDLLHVSAARILGAEELATLDGEQIRRKAAIEGFTGMKVVEV